MKHRRTLICSLLAYVLSGYLILSAPPEQFRAWGGAGGEFPPPPMDWTELPDPGTGPVGVTATAEEKQQGFIVFPIEPFAVASLKIRPFPWERAGSLYTFITPGEYEPLALVIYALDDLDNFNVRLSELRSDAGPVVPRDHMDLRVVRVIRVPDTRKKKAYRLRPFLLERRESLAMSKGSSMILWITLKAPEKAPPGRYTGPVIVEAKGRPAREIRLDCNILPIKLPPLPIEAGLYRGKQPREPAMFEKTLIDMREHGTQTLGQALHVAIKSRDREFGPDDIKATR